MTTIWQSEILVILRSSLILKILLRENGSYPPNKFDCRSFYNIGIIERWGTGTLLIADALKAQEMPPPQFDVSSSDTFKLMINTATQRAESRSARGKTE